jgi:DNA repair protein RadA/Sms
VNVVGGLRLSEPGSDLALAAALMSSEAKKPLPPSSCYFGEIGLTGEVRACSFAIERIKEAEKLGFQRIYLPASNEKYLDGKPAKGVKYIFLKEIRDLYSTLFSESGSGSKRNAESELPF